MKGFSALAMCLMTLFAVATPEAIADTARPGRPTLAQTLADQLAKDNPDLVRVGLHVTPPGTSANLIVASNVAAKVGRKSDPEDLKAMRTGKAVVLREGENFDVTLPLHDASGRVIGAVGLTLKPGADPRERAAAERALVLAKGLERQIPSLESLFVPMAN